MTESINDGYQSNEASIRPLVTFAVFAFNQSKYVKKAISAAFNQDYSPLEIILSDDCSDDDTFEIMKKEANSYNGFHRIILNRNYKNLNIAGHLNHINRLANGEMVVIAAGDDISMPDRVRRLVDAWLSDNKRAGVLHSACNVISEDGVFVKELSCPCLDMLDSAVTTATENAFVVGATGAWDRGLYEYFGDLRSDLVHEDRALPFRALLAGRTVKYVDKPLVAYRQGIGVSSAYVNRGVHLDSEQRRKVLNRLRIDVVQKIEDLQKRENPELSAILERSLAKYDVALSFEENYPKPLVMVSQIKKTNVSYVVRMVCKRLINNWRDGG